MDISGSSFAVRHIGVKGGESKPSIVSESAVINDAAAKQPADGAVTADNARLFTTPLPALSAPFKPPFLEVGGESLRGQMREVRIH